MYEKCIKWGYEFLVVKLFLLFVISELNNKLSYLKILLYDFLVLIGK